MNNFYDIKKDYYRKQCRKEIDYLYKKIKQIDIEKNIRIMQQNIKKNITDQEFVKDMKERIIWMLDIKELLKHEDTGVAFDNYFNAHPTCMPSRLRIKRPDKIITVDDENEIKYIQTLVGLEGGKDFITVHIPSFYDTTNSNLEIVGKLTEDKVLFILGQAGVPDGYVRDLVIVNDKIYKYRDYDKEIFGSMVRVKELTPIQEEIYINSHFIKKYTLREFFGFNNVILMELLIKKKD